MRSLLLKYTDQHPDVIAQRKLIDSLKNAPREVPDARRNRGEGQRRAGCRGKREKRSVPNPVYDQLKVKLIEADTAVTSLKRQRDERCATATGWKRFQREQPGLFAEYQNMDRDYAVLRNNYEDLLSRLQSANIAQAADTQADKVKLQVIDPPEIPRLPVAPNRPAAGHRRAAGRPVHRRRHDCAVRAAGPVILHGR